MKPSFNLIEEPWIPSILLDGQSTTLSLLDVLARAHEIREIYANSPLVTASLHRLLLAILHRNFGTENQRAWQLIWDAGRFDTTTLEQYFAKWHHRFYLFHEKHPFYQCPGLPEKMRGPISKLFHEAASGNNPTLFDHRFDDTPQRVPTDRNSSRFLIISEKTS